MYRKYAHLKNGVNLELKKFSDVSDLPVVFSVKHSLVQKNSTTWHVKYDGFMSSTTEKKR